MTLDKVRATGGFAIAALGLAASIAGSQAALAQTFPAQTIRIVVPYPPGGSTDLVARQFAEYLGREVGQSVVIDNRPGAATNIGADAVARARPDGYTLLFAGVGQVLNPIFGPVPPFDLFAALETVSLVSRIPFIVAANRNVAFNSPRELIAAAKAAPGKHSISSAQLDVYVELLKSRGNFNILHVPYKGGAPATTDAISGQVDMVYALVPVLLPHIQSGKLKALGVTSGKRIGALPGTPTFVESGIDYDVSIWYGLLTTAGTPKAVAARLAQATQKIVGNAEFAQKMRAGGAEPVASTPEEFLREIQAETEFWKKVATAMPNLVSGSGPAK